MEEQEDLQQELNDALIKAEENLAGWKRAQADLENYRKRTEGEKTELVNFGKQASIVQMLPVLDSLEQALIHAPELEDAKYIQWKSGLQGIVKQLDEVLRKIGIEKIEAIGKKFDPHLHEAIKEVPGKQDGMVAEQYQTGFTINGKLLRPAQVAITKKSEE